MSHFVLQNGICTIVDEFVTVDSTVEQRYDVICGSWLCNENVYYSDLFRALMHATKHRCTHDLSINMVMGLCICKSCEESYGIHF